MYSAEQSCWFVRKVICWRAAASIAWAVLLLAPTTAAFVILSRFSPLSPFLTISECLSLLTSPGAIFSYILLCGVIMIVGFLNLQYYNVIPTVACSKIDLLGQLLHPRQVVNSLVHCIIGIIVSWCSAVTIGDRYEMLGYPCTKSDGSPQICLNEYQFILLLAGVYVGFSHSLFGVIHNINYISFHPIQQYKYLHFKGSLLLVVKCSTTQALYSVRNYMVLYFFLGYLPRNWLCKTFDFNLNRSVHTLDTIAGLLDVSLLYHMWISAVFLLFMLYITLLLFRIFVTEGYSFPVQTSFSEDAQWCLPKVLSEREPMILKFLALQDLALLSQHSPSRRCEVFSLSQPGGHPHNWNTISKECLSLLTDLTQRLVAHHDTIASNGRAKSLPMEIERKTPSESSVNSGIEDGVSTKPILEMKTPSSLFSRSIGGGPHGPLTAPFTPPDLNSPCSSAGLRRLHAPLEQYLSWQGSLQSPHSIRRAPKLWSTSTDSQANESALLSPASFPSLKQEPVKPSLVAQFLQNRKYLVKNFLTKRVLIMYLFNKLPEASSEALFADSQAHIWALEGLSFLVQASFLEDQYGVIQTTLPSILSCILILQEVVDRHFKLPHASWKPVRLTSSMGESSHKTLRFALRATLKTAIYRITTTFGEHLNAVQMSAEHRKRLQQFLEYKE